MNIGVTLIQVDTLMRRIDISNDGRISYQEFIKLFQQQNTSNQPTAQPVIARKQLRSVEELMGIINDYM